MKKKFALDQDTVFETFLHEYFKSVFRTSKKIQKKRNSEELIWFFVKKMVTVLSVLKFQPEIMR